MHVTFRMHLKLCIDPIECDILSNELERAFVAWYDTHREKTKALVLIGFAALVHGSDEFARRNVTTEDASNRALEAAEARHRQLQNEIDDMRRAYDMEARSMHAIFIEQIRALEKALTEVQKQAVRELVDEKCTAEMLAFQRQAGADAERYKILFEQAQRTIDDRTHKHIRMLEDRLQERERTIELMSKTNAARGNLGEGIVTSALTDAFLDATITDTSKCKHAGDVHMRLADGRVVAFEVKMKGTVTRADVDKFMYDVKHLRETLEGFAAAVFISLASRNIPGKGDLCLEVCNGIPIVFIGFDDVGADDERFLVRVVNVLLQVQAEYASIDKRASNAADTINSFVGLIDNVRRLRAYADKARASAVASIELSDSMRKEIDTILDALMPLESIGKKNEVAGPYACNSCAAKFKTAAGLRKHVEVKHASPAVRLVEHQVQKEDRAQEQSDEQADCLVQPAP